MNKNPFLLPLSIVIAGLVIAGAIIYTPGEKKAEVKKVAEKIDYVELAGTLGLDTTAFKTCIANRTYKTEVEKDLADGSAAGVGGTPATFIGGLFIEGAYQYENYKQASEATLAGAKITPRNPELIWPTIDDDFVLGDPAAPVTMIIFGDYQCPFCGQAHNTAEKQVREKYVKTGKVKMVYRDYPLSFHPAATPAAEAAQCAGAQGKYWEYHDALFENQERL